MITVGRIVRPHGIKGAVVVEPESDFAAERFRPGEELHWIRSGVASRVTVREGREFKGRWVVLLAGVESMSEAETLRGLEFRVPVDALKVLETGSYYVHDLTGCEVVTESGQMVGRVERVVFGSSAPILEVKGERGDVLIPLAEDICRRIDTAAKRIVIDPPEGLIELNESGRAQRKEGRA